MGLCIPPSTESSTTLARPVACLIRGASIVKELCLSSIMSKSLVHLGESLVGQGHSFSILCPWLFHIELFNAQYLPFAVSNRELLSTILSPLICVNDRVGELEGLVHGMMIHIHPRYIFFHDLLHF